MISYEILFYGKVQKVSFRKTFEKLAKENNIFGYVLNKKNGIVLSHIESKNDLKVFLKNIKKNLEIENKNIKIEKIIIRKVKPKNLKDFEIKYENKLNEFLSKIHYKIKKILFLFFKF